MVIRNSPCFVVLFVFFPIMWHSALAVLPVFGAHHVAARSTDDTVLSVPFRKDTVYSGRVMQSGDTTISLSGTLPAYPDIPHYLVVLDGVDEGCWWNIESWSDSTVVLGESHQSEIVPRPGDRVSVVAHWRLSDLLGESTRLVHDSGGHTLFERRTQVFFYENDPEALLNVAPQVICYRVSGKWFEADADRSSADGRVVSPGTFFWMRHHPADDGTADVFWGEVDFGTQAYSLETSLFSSLDNLLSLNRPVPVTLDEAGLLEGSSFTGSNGTSIFNRRDLAMIHVNNAEQGLNPLPDLVAYYDNNAETWRDLVDNTAIESPEVQPIHGIIIRKHVGTPPTLWQSLSNHPNTNP